MKVSLLGGMAALFPNAKAQDAPCRPFRLHAGVRLPTSEERRQADAKTSPAFDNIRGEIEATLALHGTSVDWNGEFWKCVRPYLKLDRDGDGLSDWTVSIDAAPSPVLIPLDPDLDGDGVENLFDVAPNDARLGSITPKGLPPHLVARDAETRALQLRIYERYGLVAVDNSDAHSPGVLRTVDELLEGLPEIMRQARGLRLLFAFAGHDARHDQAAYHRQMRALSLGGRKSYPDRLDAAARAELLHTLAHEIGHAVLFDLVGPAELQNFASHQAGWRDVFAERPETSLLGPAFFRPFPRRSVSTPAPLSPYAKRNLHEWFAEAYAATALKRLIARGRLDASQVRQRGIERLDENTENWVKRLADFDG